MPLSPIAAIISPTIILTLFSIRFAHRRSERIEDVRRECVEGVKACGGDEKEGNEIAKMFGEEVGDNDGGDDRFEPAASFDGAKAGKVYKLDDKGLGYYNDVGLKGLKVNKIEEERLLDPDHPAFKDMNPAQVRSLEQMLKLTDKEVDNLPGDQKEMIQQFRSMWKSNPSAFKNYKANQAAKKGEGEGGEKKKKETKHDPTKWMADHAEGLNWFMEKHGDFDREKFLKQEKEREDKEREEEEKKQAGRKLLIENEARDLFGDAGLRDEKKEGVEGGGKKAKKTKGTKKRGKKDDKAAQIKELMSWSS